MCLGQRRPFLHVVFAQVLLTKHGAKKFGLVGHRLWRDGQSGGSSSCACASSPLIQTSRQSIGQLWQQDGIIVILRVDPFAD